MSARAGQIDPVPRWGAHETASLLAFAGALVALVCMPFATEQRWPPAGEPGRAFEWALSVVLIGLALVSSGSSPKLWVRLIGAFALIVGVVSFSFANIFSALNDVGDPLIGFIFLALMVGIGGWFCRQRVVAVVTVVVLAVVVGSALLPGRGEATLDSHGIKATLVKHAGDDQATGAGFGLVLTSSDGTPLGAKMDERAVRVSSTVGLLLPVHAQDIRPAPEWMTGVVPNTNRFSGGTTSYPPTWAPSVNLALTVQMLPSKPLLAVRIPLDPMGHAPERIVNGDAWMQISEARWAKSTNTLPAMPCLAFAAIYLVPGSTGYDAAEFRTTDDRGTVLDAGSHSSQTKNGVSTEEFQVIGLRKGAKWVDFSICSEKQLDANKVTFKFERMAAR